MICRFSGGMRWNEKSFHRSIFFENDLKSKDLRWTVEKSLKVFLKIMKKK